MGLQRVKTPLFLRLSASNLQRNQALGFLEEMRGSRLEPDVITFNAVISACSKGQQCCSESGSSYKSSSTCSRYGGKHGCVCKRGGVTPRMIGWATSRPALT